MELKFVLCGLCYLINLWLTVTYMKTGFPKDLSGLYAKEVHAEKEVF